MGFSIRFVLNIIEYIPIHLHYTEVSHRWALTIVILSANALVYIFIIVLWLYAKMGGSTIERRVSRVSGQGYKLKMRWCSLWLRVSGQE